MKKLLILSLLFSIPAVAMQPQARVNIPSTYAPGMYIHPTVARFTGADAPAGQAVMHIVHNDKPEIIDYPTLPVHLASHIEGVDANGRNLVWWVALMGKKNLYNNLVNNGANPDVKSTSGLLAGFSARQLIEMGQDDIDALIEAGPNAAKAKL